VLTALIATVPHQQKQIDAMQEQLDLLTCVVLQETKKEQPRIEDQSAGLLKYL
jgi:uncharacterized coiled-coil protein SlyX